MRYSVAYNYAESHHPAKCKSPLGKGDGDQARFAVAMLHGSLKGVRSAELRVYDDESNRPIDCYSQGDQEYGACQ